MKAKVIKVFRDKTTDSLQEIGTELEITRKRFDEINSTVFGVFLEELEEEDDKIVQAKAKAKSKAKKTTKK